MSRNLEKAGSLFNIICRSKHEDCVSFFDHLNVRGIELVCKLLYFIISGDLELHSTSHEKLKKKLKKHKNEIKKLFLVPRHDLDIAKKKKILQTRGIISSLTAVAAASVPIIKSKLKKKKKAKKTK